MNRPDRTVGTKVRGSQAAERALDLGEEVEDTLWMGSGRINGSYVRRQLQASRSKKNRSRRGGFAGSQRFLQSMRFWESRRPSKRLDSTHNSSRYNNNNNSNMHMNNRSTNPLEYNGGKETSTRMVVRDIRGLNTTLVNAATKATTTNPLGSLLSTTNSDTATRRGEVTRLLSMRCEASRSMRRQRGGGGPCGMVQWLIDEPVAAVTTSMEQTLEATNTTRTGRRIPIPFLKTKNSPGREQNRLTKSTLHRDAEDALTTSNHKGGTLKLNNSSHHKRQTDKAHHSNTDPTKSPKSHKKRWGLRWTKRGHDKHEDGSRQSLSMESRDSHDDHDEISSPVVPAHVQLARSQKRNDALHRGSRHLEQGRSKLLLNANNASGNDTNSSSDAHEFGGDGGEHDIHNLGSTASGHARNPLHKHEYRSTRFDVHSNQPLLVRGRARMALTQGGHPLGGSTDYDSDEDTVDRSAIGKHTGTKSRGHGRRAHHGPTKQQQSAAHTATTGDPLIDWSPSRNSFTCVPPHVNINEPTSRGSLLVNQVSGLSGLSVPLGLGYDDNDVDDDEEEIIYSVQELIDSTRATTDSIRSADAFDISTITTTTATSSQLEQPQPPKQQQWQHRGVDPDGSRLHYWFEDEDEVDATNAAHSLRTYASKSPPAAASYFMQQQAGLGHLESLAEEVEGDLTESEHRSNFYGPDANFGRTTLESSLSSLMKLKKNDSESSSHDSKTNNYFGSRSFHHRDSKRSNDGSFGSQEDSNNSHSQQSRATDNSSHHSGSPSQSPRRKTLPANALGPRQNAMRGGLMSECAEEALAQRRRSSLPSSIPLSLSGDIGDTQSVELAMRHDRDGQKDDPPGVALSTSLPDPPGQNRAGSSDSDEEGCEVVWKDTEEGDSGGNDWWQVASDDGSDLQKTQSFCTKLHSSWEEQMEEDAMAAYQDELAYYDTRSVVSEPADIGLGEPLMTAVDPTKNRWLFAWDDLALL